MLLDELFDYKNELMKTICNNAEIIHLVTDSEDAPCPNYDLPYKQIFPYEYVPDTVDHGKTFICFDVDIQEVYSKTTYNPVIYIWIFTHTSKLQLPEGGVRIDKIAVEINKELSGSRTFGLGELELRLTDRFVPINDYLGRVLVYSAKDFNRPSSRRPYKNPPANRKDV